MKKQYMILDPTSGHSLANVFAAKVEDYRDHWQLYLHDEFAGNVWKGRAILELCQHEYVEAAAEAHYPIIRIGFSWPIRMAAEVAGSVGR